MNINVELYVLKIEFGKGMFNKPEEQMEEQQENGFLCSIVMLK